MEMADHRDQSHAFFAIVLVQYKNNQYQIYCMLLHTTSNGETHRREWASLNVVQACQSLRFDSSTLQSQTHGGFG